MTGTVLERIAEATKRRIEEAQQKAPQSSLRKRLESAPATKPFSSTFLSSGPNIIAEVKLASPSEGELAPGADPVTIAGEYAANGAAALSILTEPEFFRGDISYLSDVRKAVALPLLMKDFLIDEYQILQGRANGADCVLLIMALLGEKRTDEMLQAALEIGLEVLVEVHDAEEMEAALRIGAKLIGVNNRNLKTLEIDLDVSRTLITKKTDQVFICESGIRSSTEIREFTDLGFNGFLIGTHLIKSGKPGEALGEILGGKAA
jgi:indole-3-glycerol phosphate synthase